MVERRMLGVGAAAVVLVIHKSLLPNPLGSVALVGVPLSRTSPPGSTLYPSSLATRKVRIA
jgi:hypothetical protein